MYCVIVRVGDRSIEVPCTPSTPLAEVLRRAAAIVEREVAA